MKYSAKDKVYERIEKKVEDEIFTKGNNCRLARYYFESETIDDFPLSERTPEVCSSLMDYGRCGFSDVPISSRTREFYISNFTNVDVNDYIKNHINDFDRQFFKDLIASNEHATNFDSNCFSIMPLEYIDEEMCSLAILSSLDWSDDSWFYSVNERKPEALTADLWKLGARLYSGLSGEQNRFLDITPEEYKDEEYYKEMCSCNFNCGMELDDNKGKIMDSLPQEILTPEFLLDLLNVNIGNIAGFNEKALETKIMYTREGNIISEKIWQFVVRLKGDTIRNIALNDERIEFFLSYYDKDSSEYRWAFKDKYKRYKKEKNDAKSLAQTDERIRNRAANITSLTLFSAFVHSLNGEDPSKAIDDVTNATRTMGGASFIPIKYQGKIPQEFCKEYDSEEYLEMIYKILGIQIIEEWDDLFYNVKLPEGWTVDNNVYWNDIKDSNGNIVIQYFYDSQFYDRDAYVSTINIPEDKKVFVKKSKERITE